MDVLTSAQPSAALRPQRDSGYFYFVLDPQDFLESNVPRIHDRPPAPHHNHPNDATLGRPQEAARPTVLKFGPRPQASTAPHGHQHNQHRGAVVPVPSNLPHAPMVMRPSYTGNDGQQRLQVLQQESPRCMDAADELPSDHQQRHDHRQRQSTRDYHRGGSTATHDHPPSTRTASPRALASVPVMVKSPSPVAPKRLPLPSPTAAAQQPQPTQRPSSPSPELSVGITEASPPRYVPHISHESQKLDVAVQRRRVAELQNAGLLARHNRTEGQPSSQEGGNDGEAPCSAQDLGLEAGEPGNASAAVEAPPPRWVVLHHMAEVLHAKRQAAIEAHDEATAVALELEIASMKRSQESLRYRSRHQKPTAATHQRQQQQAQPPTAVVSRTMSPASTSTSQPEHQLHDADGDLLLSGCVSPGATDAPRTFRQVPPELVPVMEAKAHVTTLHPRQQWDQHHQHAVVAALAGEHWHATSSTQSNSSDSPPRAQRTVPSPSPSPRQRRIPGHEAGDEEETASCSLESNHAGITTSRPPRFQRASYQEESHSFHPKITRGPRPEYYEKHYGHMVSPATTVAISSNAGGAQDLHSAIPVPQRERGDLPAIEAAEPAEAPLVMPFMGREDERAVADDELVLDATARASPGGGDSATADMTTTTAGASNNVDCTAEHAPPQTRAPADPTTAQEITEAAHPAAAWMDDGVGSGSEALQPHANVHGFEQVEVADDGEDRRSEASSTDVEAILREGEQALRDLDVAQQRPSVGADAVHSPLCVASMEASTEAARVDASRDDAARTADDSHSRPDTRTTSSSGIALPRVVEQQPQSISVPNKRRHHSCDDDAPIPGYNPHHQLQDGAAVAEVTLPSMEPTPRAFDEAEDGHNELRDLFARGIAAVRD